MKNSLINLEQRFGINANSLNYLEDICRTNWLNLPVNIVAENTN